MTRFFLFAPWAFALLCVKLLGLPLVDRLHATNCRVRQTDPSCAQFLQVPRGACYIVALCFRLTLFATNITARRSSEDTGADPPLVRLGKREVQQRTSALLVEILPLLPKVLALRHLLLTEARLIMRFDVYTWFPTKLWTLTRQYNPANFGADTIALLRMDPSCFDTGYSLLCKGGLGARIGGGRRVAPHVCPCASRVGRNPVESGGGWA